MKTRRVCPVCQRPTSRMICGRCKRKWGADSNWVKELVLEEQKWRLTNRREARFAPIHISVEGDLYHSDKHVPNTYLLKQLCQLNRLENEAGLEDLELWINMGEFTPRKQLIYHLMLDGFTHDESGALISEIEHKIITSNASRQRFERLLKKIHDGAEKAGQIEAHF